MRKTVNILGILLLMISCLQVAGQSTINVPGDYGTIQQAVNAASPNDLVLVGDGTYSENVTIDKDLSLLSVNGMASTTIHGSSSGGNLGTIQINSGCTAHIGAPGQGFTIIGYDGPTPGLEHAVIYFQGSNTGTVIKNNEIVADGDAGVQAEWGATIDGLVIDNNVFSGKTFTGTNPAGDGFSAQFTLPNVPRSIIYIGGVNKQNIQFTNNVLTGVSGGCSVTDNSGNTIPSHEQGNDQVTLDGDNITITGNTFSGTTTSYANALRARGSTATYTISGNTFDGINPAYFYGGSDPTLGPARATMVINNNTFADPGTFVNSSYVIPPSYAFSCGTDEVAVDDDWSGYSNGYVVMYNGNSYIIGINAFDNIVDGINAVDADGIINVANGTYTETSTVNIQKALSIIGESEAGVTIDLSAVAGYGFDIQTGNIIMKNFTVLPNPTTGTYTLKTNPVGGAVYDGLNYENITIIGARKTPFDIHGYDNVVLTNLTAKNTSSGVGIAFSGCDNVTMSGITTEGNAWGGVAVYVSTYVNRGSSNINFDYSANNVSDRIYVEDEQGLTNSSITILNWTFGVQNSFAVDQLYTGYLNGILADALQHAADMNTAYGNQDAVVFDPSGTFYVSNGMSIQAAIDAASPGDDIQVSAGTYNEALTIDKALSLLGENAKGTVAVLDGTGLGTSGISISSSDVTIDNFEIMNYQSNGIVVGYPLDLAGYQNIVVTNNIIHDIAASHGFGIYAGYQSEDFVGGPSFGNDVITDFLNYTGLVVSGNEVYNTAGAGIVIQSVQSTSTPLQITGNHIYNAGQSGIWVDTSKDLDIENNTSENNGSAGIFISTYADGYYEGTPNHQYDCRDLNIEGNTLTSNDRGISLYDGWPSLISILNNNISNNNNEGVYNFLSEYIDATYNWWGDPSGPYHGTNNPTGTGNAVSDYVYFIPWYTDPSMTNTNMIDIGLYQTTCGDFEVRVMPFEDINGEYLTNLQFAVKWEGATGLDLINVNSSYGVAKAYDYDDGTTKYSVFIGLPGSAVNWTAGTEYVVCTFSHDETGSGTADFEIADDVWTQANNADYYIELNGLDNTGLIYQDAPGVFLGSCDAQIKVYLQGPYNDVNDNMDANLYGESDFPLTQPYNVSPWNYSGTESITGTDPSIVDWVLVELRTGPNEADLFERKAGFLLEDGTIAQYDDLTAGIRFDNVIAGDDYYIVVWHRNHMPVMSGAVVELPNATAYDFTEVTSTIPYGHVPGSSMAENQVDSSPEAWAMITGDINSDGMLKYSGANNDRALIIQRIFSEVASPTLNSTVDGYFDSDINMDYTTKYVGGNNDRDDMVTSLFASAMSSYLNAVYYTVVPGANYTSKALSSNNGPLHISIQDNEDHISVVLEKTQEIDGLVDNVQFTLQWETGNDYMEKLMTLAESYYGITPQGPAYQKGDYSYQVFVGVTPFGITQESTELVTLPKYNDFQVAGTLNIASDEVTNQINGSYYISVYGKDMTGEVLENKVGLGEEATSQIAIYPNPVNTTLNITVPQTGAFNLTLTDLQGKTVVSETTTSNSTRTQIDVSSLNKGVYLLRLQNNEEVFNSKIVIQ